MTALDTRRLRNFLFILILFLMVGLGRKVDADGPGNGLTIYLQSRTFSPAGGIDLPRMGDAARYGMILFTRPLLPADRAAVNAAGVNLLHYLPNNAWLASFPADINPAAGLPFVHWIGPILPTDKLDNFLRTEDIPFWAANPDGTIRVEVYPFADVAFDEFVALVDGYGLLNGTMPETGRVLATFPAGVIADIAAEETVRWLNVAAPEPHTLNAGSRAATETEPVQAAPYALNGAGVRVAMWDEGVVDESHPDFAGRVIIPIPDTVEAHATHVAGTVLGDGTNSENQELRGYAPGAELISYDWASPITGHDNAINIYGADVSQNSWGMTACSIFGYYGYYADDYDDVITGLYGRRIPVVFAAGNSNGQCGYTYGTVLGSAQSAKNVVTVGGVESDTGNLLAESSWGPVQDGRLKPELVAPGGAVVTGGILSTIPGGGYTAGTGTSMAAPAVSGAMALMLERYHAICPASGDSDGNPLPSTLRALLVHTAADMDDPAQTHLNPGPDFATGFGELDSQAAVDMLAHHVEDSLSQGENALYTLIVPAGAELKITLAWDDVPGTSNAALALVNDLDLTLVSPDGTLNGPWLLNSEPGHEAEPAIRPVNDPAMRDDRNVIEQVVVDNPQAGLWTVQVAGTNLPEGPQSYSLVGDLLVESSCSGAPVTDLWLAGGNGPEGDPPILVNDDIWVQHEPENNGSHMNPEYGQTNFAFARVYNGGQETAYDVQVAFYWASMSGTLGWPDDLTYIGSTMITNFPAGAEAIAGPVNWTPPPPDTPDGTDYYLFVRLVSGQDPLIEGDDFWMNLNGNNGIGGKTVRVVNEIPDDPTAIQLAMLDVSVVNQMPWLPAVVFFAGLSLWTMHLVTGRKKPAHVPRQPPDF